MPCRTESVVIESILPGCRLGVLFILWCGLLLDKNLFFFNPLDSFSLGFIFRGLPVHRLGWSNQTSRNLKFQKHFSYTPCTSRTNPYKPVSYLGTSPPRTPYDHHRSPPWIIVYQPSNPCSACFSSLRRTTTTTTTATTTTTIATTIITIDNDNDNGKKHNQLGQFTIAINLPRINNYPLSIRLVIW